MRCALCFLLFSVSALLAQTKLSFESRVALNGEGEAVLTNRSSVPIVAWIFEVLREPCNPIEANQHTYAGYDSAAMPEDSAIPALGSHVQNIGVSHCNKVGTHSPNRASLKIALFADGSSFGDQQWLKILRRDRRLRVERIDRAIHALKQMNGSETRSQCVALLEKAGASLPEAPEPQVEYAAPDPFESAIRELTEQQTTPVKSEIANLLSSLLASRDRLK